MTVTNRIRTILALQRAAANVLGLAAVIIGILTIHVGMGGHGPTATHGLHTVTGPVATVHQSPAPTDGGADTGVADQAHVGAWSGNTDTSELVQGCAGHCENDSAALGLCVLAFIVVTILAFLFPAGRLVPGAVLLRGPPWIRLQPLSIPVPSLIRLCISRT